MDGASLGDLEQQRDRLYAELAATGDFRRGSISENTVAAGNRIARARNRIIPDTGRHLWTRTVAGRGTKGRQLSAAEVDKVRAELANYRRFAEVSEKIVAVNEEIWSTPTGCERDGAPGRDRGRRGSATRSPRRSRPR